MPRTKVHETTEHRITLGTWERNLARQLKEQQERNIWIDGVSQVGIGAVGLGAVLAGVGIFAWGGGSVKGALTSLWEGTKNFVQDVADPISTALADNILPTTSMEKRAVAIGIRIKEIHARQGEIQKQINTLIAIHNLGLQGNMWPQIQELIAEGTALDHEERKLRDELEAIAQGVVHWTNWQPSS